MEWNSSWSLVVEQPELAMPFQHGAMLSRIQSLAVLSAHPVDHFRQPFSLFLAAFFLRHCVDRNGDELCRRSLKQSHRSLSLVYAYICMYMMSC
ncbi:hypothetical protein F0562_002077 [Nyssa sinensis]|uniref:Uncharacterized protein n=1 Tax=Nyssa sinensis TaxID=561372 RepID=A0A5J5C4R9_9ASTE|nr:hypothetical protein F0562_002077 [Nyssa sinensis]